MSVELNTIAPRKWVANYSGSAPTIDTTDGVAVGDFAVDSSNDAVWRCTDNTDTAAVWADVGGWNGTYREIFIPAAAMTPDVTNPPAAGTDTTAGRNAQDYYAFDDASSEHVFFTSALPTAWDLGEVKIRFYWKWTAGTTGNCKWEVRAKKISNDESWNPTLSVGVSLPTVAAPTSGTVSNDGVLAITPAGTPAANDLIRWHIARLGGDGGDSLVGDALLAGVFIQYLESSTEPTGW